MMHRRVNFKLQPKINLEIYASDGNRVVVEALIDTGCTFLLVLEKTLVKHVLQLPHVMQADVKQADGNTSRHPVYAGKINWKGEVRDVNIVAMGDETIIGMEMLRGSHWYMDINPGGDLIIS